MSYKVLYLISTLGGGGAESYLCSFSEELALSHPEVSFTICALKKGGVFQKKLQDCNMKHMVIGGKGIIRHAVIVARLVRKERIDIIHSHMLYADIVARLAKLMSKCYVVSTHHGLGKWKKKLLIAIDRLTKGLVDHFIMVSDKSKEIRIKREKYSPDKITVIYNGISQRFCENEGKTIGNKITIGTIARFTDNKQINLLIDVFYALRGIGNINLEIIGAGENEIALKQQVKNLKIEEQVTFHGWLNDIKPVTKNWNIFVLCSINEDLPISLIETMAQGIVPVASNVGGIPLLLKNGELGMLCDSKNKEVFIDGIRFLIDNPDVYQSMSTAAVKYIKDNFLIDMSVEKTLDIYNKLIKG